MLRLCLEGKTLPARLVIKPSVSSQCSSCSTSMSDQVLTPTPSLASRHRTPTSHSCVPVPRISAAAAQKAQTKSLISSTFSSNAGSSSSSRAVPSPAQPALKRKRPSPAIELMKMKQLAKPGRLEIPDRPTRWHLRVGMDLDWSRDGKGTGQVDATYWRKVSSSLTLKLMLFN